MPVDPRVAIERAARELLQNLAGLADTPRVRVTDAQGRLACMILVWDAAGVMPTAAGERRAGTGGRAGCRADILAVIRDVGRALSYKQVLRALRDAGKVHGPGTVEKALAELTRAGELVNPRDRKGYRLPPWPRPSRTPSMFG